MPSFNFPQPSIADGSDALRPATLRGLSPDQTLVLINGKRRHVSALLNINGTVGRGSAAVDMNLIPGLAISRVEVLRDGAAAQYGSDAIAGVINIQLKSADHGGRASVTYGKYYTTIDNVANVTGLSSMAPASPSSTPPTTAISSPTPTASATRMTAARLTVGANLGIPIGPNGFFNVTGEFRDRDAHQPRRLRPPAQLQPADAPRLRPARGRLQPAPVPLRRSRHRATTISSSMPAFDLGGSLEALRLRLLRPSRHGQRRQLAPAERRRQPRLQRRWRRTRLRTRPTSSRLTPDGFLPLIDTDLDDYRRDHRPPWRCGGLEGRPSATGTARTASTMRSTTRSTPRSARRARAMFDAGGLRYAQDIFNLDFSREFEVGIRQAALGRRRRRISPRAFRDPAGRPPVLRDRALLPRLDHHHGGELHHPAGRVQRRHRRLQLPGPRRPAGAQGFPGIPDSSATDVGRHSWAAYVELDTDPIEGVTTTIAGRYEHFSDFGSTWNGKFAARWEPVDGFALRGSVSNGFRAPSLHQQFFTTTSTNFIAGLPVDISTLAVNSPVALALGAQPLEPEKSFNVSLGATANPLRGLTITADLYQIKIKDRIVLTETLGAAAAAPRAQNAAVKAILDANGFQSVGAGPLLHQRPRHDHPRHRRRRRLPHPGGRLGNWSLSAAYNYNKTKIDERLNALGPLATIPGLVLFGRVEGLRFTHGQPRDKIVFSADGDIGDFGITARTTRYGKVVSPGAAAPIANPLSLTAFGPDDIFLKAKWITDLEFRYKAVGGTRARDRRQQSVRRLPDPLALRRRGRRAIGGVYPANQDIYPLFDLLALRLQRPLPLRPGLGRLLRGAAAGPSRLSRSALVPVLGPQLVAAALEAAEQAGDRRMVDRLVAVVANQVLLADVGDVALSAFSASRW